MKYLSNFIYSNLKKNRIIGLSMKNDFYTYYINAFKYYSDSNNWI